jgi:hypothetical protein
MQRLEVSGAVRPLKWPLGVKWLIRTTPLFCKMGPTHQIPIVLEQQEGGSVLHATNALKVRISSNYLACS